MKKKKLTTISPGKDELQKQLQRKNSTIEKYKREVKIEVSLERVRARTMTMHQSNELADTASVLFKQIKELGFETWSCGFCIWKKNDMAEVWMAADSGGLLPPMMIPYKKEPTHAKIHEASLRGDIVHDHTWEGKELARHYAFLKTIPSVKEAIEILEKSGLTLPSRQCYYVGFFKHGYLLLITKEPNAELKNLSKRFASVFDLTYTRFLDLQKAEAQAREAKIEAALERVRSRSMAMQKSIELVEVVHLLNDEIDGLGIKVDGTSIITDFSEPEKGVNNWFAARGRNYLEKFQVPLDDSQLVSRRFMNARSKGLDYYTEKYNKVEKNRYFRWLYKNSDFKKIPEDRQRFTLNAPGWTRAVSISKNSVLIFQWFRLEEFTEEENSIFKRFGKVFEQTYTRFLDLQNAEAQVRESEIQLALERVRASSMAMHQSIDLHEVIKVVADQFAKINLKFDAVSFFKIDETGSWDLFISTPEQPYPAKISVPYRDIKIFNDFNESKKAGKDFYTHSFTKEDKNAFFTYFFTNTSAKNIPEERKRYVLNGNGYATSAVHTKYISLVIANYQGDPFNDETNGILKRFANVFEQAYIRFLDLQNAEAQVREAQIEAALERVRSSSMAMHQSSDLHNVIQVVTDQLCGLDLKFDVANFAKVDEHGNWDMWLSTPDQHYPALIFVPFFDHPIFNKVKEIIKNNITSYSDVYGFEEKNRFFKHFFENTDAKHAPETRKQHVLNRKGFARSLILLKNIWFSVANYDGTPFKEEETNIFRRFAGVFEQSYTRFLDLQRAEGQAKEAKIEAALEKIRSRSLAMHKSDEIQHVVDEVSMRLKEIGVGLDTANILIFKENAEDVETWTASTPSSSYSTRFLLPVSSITHFSTMINAIKTGQELVTNKYDFDEKNKFFNYLFEQTDYRNIPEERKHFLLNSPCFTVSAAISKNIAIQLNSYSRDAFSEEENNILKRFTKVFEQAYTRFLDLQKAETQTKEAHIQLALERVRARTMAMHKSEELGDISFELVKQIQSLGVATWHCAFNIYDEDEESSTEWGSNAYGTYPKYKTPRVGIFKRYYEIGQTGETLHIEVIGEEKCADHYAFLCTLPGVGTQLIKLRDSGVSFPASQIDHVAYFKYGYLLFITYEPVPEAHDVFRRFANVFEQTYTRFLDLQKAEAQAREAQIEVALERIRARTMAMHKSDELSESATLLYQQLGSLGVNQFFSCGYVIIDEDKKSQYGWMTNFEGSITDRITLPLTGEHAFNERFESWKKKDPVFHQSVGGENLQRHIEFAMPHIGSKEVEQLVRTQFPDPTIFYCFNFSSGYLHLISDTLIHKDQEYLLTRFTNVFEMTYKRFLDLKKAETQAREAQVETALERVRSKTMAMHNSQDVGDTVSTMFDQLVQLGVTTNRCGILIFSNSDNTEVWTAKSNPYGEAALIIGHLDVMIHPMLQGVRHAWKNKESFFYYELKDENIKGYYSAINNHPGYPTRFNLDSLPSKEIHSDFFFPEGCVFAFTSEPIDADASIIFKRFAGVFGQTYRRYLDLQKAETQARQAQIEAALEKVRARALAMQKPDELVEVAQVLRKEMGLLGVEELETSSIYIHNETSGNTECWYAIKKIQDDEKKLVTDHMIIKLEDTWVGRQMLEFYNSDKKQISIPMQGNNRKEWIHYCANHSKVLDGFYGEHIPDRTYHLNKFSHGYIGAASPGDISDESWELLQRATAVFSLAYTRFRDLQHAEAQTKEAIKRASVDRVRAEIASMRTTSDLEKITPLVWNELTTIGVPFIRCGVFIMDEVQQQIHTFLSTPDGKAIAAFNTSFANQGTLTEALPYWRKREIYKTHWDEAQFLEQARTLIQQGAISSPEKYLTEHRPTSLYLHFLPFLQGMLYVGSETSLTEEELQLVQNLANAFSTAYARYEDFNKLEEAKSKIETTLRDLKSTQSQLVQSEKMASLGELTAGIAHEIQNPLNFVNNFASINAELIDEMNVEIEKGNSDEVKALAVDIKDNEQKIMHHGKRAESIVKGMLQHSRKSTGIKEPTDINALADEYMRLSYHGLRAKDKSFNAEFRMDLDPTLPLVKVIPQDIGRVLLNLFNNAFWAANKGREGEMENGEKEKPSGLPSSISPFLPQVSLTTKNLGDHIEIRIHDNGPGIPSNIIDKIFQPFFTTKPTGQGTGLGLSLAYDIIKAHSGTIEVKSNELSGTEFIIQLPIT